MTIISKIAWKNSGVEVFDDIDVKGVIYFWLNEKHIETKIGHSNLPIVTNKYDPEYKKCRFELIDETEYQPYRKSIHHDLAEKLVKTVWTDNIDAFKRSLGFNVQDVFNTKEQTVLKLIKDAFEGENMQTQYNVLDYRIDFFFHDYRLAIEVDELGHSDRNIDYEIE